MSTPLRVGFNARLLSNPSLRGWNRYTVNLIAQLPQYGVRPVLLAPQPIHPSHLERFPVDRYEVHVAPPMRNLKWEQFWLPQQCRKLRLDLLHSTFNFGLPWLAPCPMLLTLHDTIDPIYYGRQTAWYDRIRPKCLISSAYHWLARTRADRIMTVSQHAKSDIVKYLRVPARRIDVTYEAADPHFHEPISTENRHEVRQRYSLPDRYIFYVGGWEKRKNIPFLLRAFAEAACPNLHLVLAGGNEDRRTELMTMASELGIADRLRLIGWVDEADLPALYTEALVFVYPSEYEGFGLQLCEAMACGCPVLAARATCLPEILGNGGETFTLKSTGELVTLLHRISSDESYRRTQIERATTRSKDFSWQSCAKETAESYYRLLKRRQGGTTSQKRH